MKNFFRGKITFTKFLIGIFCLFFLVILINVGKFFWESYDISQQNITILTQSEFSLGGTGSLQVFVRNIDKNENIKDGEIDLFLNKTPTKGENGSVDKLFTGNFIDGYLSTSFKLPDFLNVGEYELVIDVKSKFGKDKIKKSIKISSNSKLVISTDRPLYKPGQDMNFRVLLLDKSSLKPFSSKDLQISVVNPNGDKIFQKNYKTSEYGIASDNFSFANKLAFGEYKITVNADKATGEKIVNVKEFTLPKFEISILPDQDLTKVEDRVSGKILAKYFFGKPLVNADVKLKVDIDGRKHFLIDKTNDEGILKFDFDLFRKKEINQILINVEVVDANKNTIIAQKVATVAQKDIVVELIPESGKLKPGLENEILFISSRSDGTPVKTSIFMTGERIREFATNEYGIAKFKYKPDENSSLSRFTLTVKDEQGNVLKKPFSLQNEMGDSGHLILRTDKTFFEGNSKIKLDILSTRDVATQVEFIQDNCIVHTESFDLQDGKISKEIELPEHIFGTVEMRAIQTVQNTSISNNRRYNNKSNINVNFATDSKIILVDRPKNLQVEIELDKNTYLPGSEAKVSFKVQDENGNLENSALGIKIVDEALLALEDDNENLNKLLFLVDNKIHENAKSINGLTWNKTLEDDTLKIKDSILQAMFVDVPRSKISFSRIEKNNYDVWRDYKNSKNNLFRSAFLFLFFIIFVFALKFLWNITELSAKKNATLKIWGGSFIVSILTISVGTLFVKSANRYYDFGDKVGDVFSFFIEDIFFKIIEKPVLFYFILILIVLLAGSIYIAYQRKNQLIEIKSLLTSFFILFGSLTFFSILEYFDIGISSIFHNDTWQAFAMFLLSILILGAINYFIVKSLKDNEFIITSWLLVLLIGIISLMFVPMMIIIYIILLLFGFIRLSKNNSNISDDELKLLELEVKLKEKDDVNEVSRMELILLRRDIEQKKRSSVVVSIILIIISVLTLLWLNKIMLYQEFLQLIFSLPFVAIIFGSIWKLIDPENKKRFNGKTLVSAGLISILIIIVFIIIFGFLRVSMQSSIRNSNIPDRWSKGTSFGGTSIDSVSSGFGMEHYAESTNLGSANPMAMPSFSGILDKFDGSGTKNKKVISDTNEQEIVFNDEVKEKKEEFKKAKRVRKFFPETMFWNSEIIAENGLASLIIPVKDSITKWRLSALANSLSGKVGSADKNLVTFQDFFIDFDLPANLTKGDELTIPVSVFNYLEESQKIKMVVKDGSWFELLNDKENIIELNSNEVKTFYVKIQLLKHGDFVLRIDGQGTKQADAVEKILTVLPFGQRITQTIASEKLNMDLTELQAIFPNERIEGTEKVIVKILPSVLSEIVEGLESILRQPSGCFEQTSSALYPNILVLKYMENAGISKPEIKAKAEKFIEQGLQKLLTFELEPGGFSYFGRQPTETILSAYGLMEFNEMKEVSFVDNALIERTKNFLYKQQNHDGSFKLTGHHKGGFSGGDNLAKNAYIIWALTEVDINNVRLKKSIKFLEDNFDELKSNPYSLALATNAFVNVDANSKNTNKAIGELKQFVEQIENNKVQIKLKKPTHYGSWGRSGSVEVSALAAITFAKVGETDFSQKLVDYIVSQKYSNRGWGTTQSTILALKALVENEISHKVVKNNNGKLKITFNDNEIKTLKITPENSEVVQYLIFDSNIENQNHIKIEKAGKIDTTIHIAKDYYRKWDNENESLFNDMKIEALLDAGKNWPNINLGDKIDMYIGISSNKLVKNTIIEIPVPSGFDVGTESLNIAVNNIISRYEITKGRIVLYLDESKSREEKIIKIEMTPKFKGKFKLLPSRFSSYYDPESEAFSKAISEIIVK